MQTTRTNQRRRKTKTEKKLLQQSIQFLKHHLEKSEGYIPPDQLPINLMIQAILNIEEITKETP